MNELVMNLDLTQIVVALIGLLGIIITSVVVPMIKANTSVKTQTIIANIIKTAVYAAQQIYTPEQWEEKKEFAMEQVTKGLEQYGVTLDEDTISDAIEAALKEIKTAIDGNWDGSENSDPVKETTKSTEVA